MDLENARGLAFVGKYIEKSHRCSRTEVHNTRQCSASHTASIECKSDAILEWIVKVCCALIVFLSLLYLFNNSVLLKKHTVGFNEI